MRYDKMLCRLSVRLLLRPQQLRKEGFDVRIEDVARLSPHIHDHINMQGRYSLTIPDAVAKGALRPLRDPAMDD